MNNQLPKDKTGTILPKCIPSLRRQTSRLNQWILTQTRSWSVRHKKLVLALVFVLFATGYTLLLTLTIKWENRTGVGMKWTQPAHIVLPTDPKHPKDSTLKPP